MSHTSSDPVPRIRALLLVTCAHVPVVQRLLLLKQWLSLELHLRPVLAVLLARLRKRCTLVYAA